MKMMLPFLMAFLLCACGSDSADITTSPQTDPNTPNRESLEGEKKISTNDLLNLIDNYYLSGKAHVYIGETVKESSVGPVNINGEDCIDNSTKMKTVIFESAELVKIYVDEKSNYECEQSNDSASNGESNYRYVEVYKNGLFYKKENKEDMLQYLKDTVVYKGQRNGEDFISLAGKLTIEGFTANYTSLIALDRSLLSLDVKSSISYEVNEKVQTTKTNIIRLADIDPETIDLELIQEVEIKDEN